MTSSSRNESRAALTEANESGSAPPSTRITPWIVSGRSMDSEEESLSSLIGRVTTLITPPDALPVTRIGSNLPPPAKSP